MRRSTSKPDLLTHRLVDLLPPEPDGPMPIRFGTREQLAEIHRKYWGPLSSRSIERWDLVWRIVNGHAVSNVAMFIAKAQKRFDDSPATRGGRRAKQPVAKLDAVATTS
jgi:hypothetical protein